MISGSETSSSLSFPLGRTVAFCGSRYGSPFPVSLVVAAVLSAGGSVRVGYAPGVDAAVRSCCPSAVVVCALSFPGPPRARLAARTRPGGPDAVDDLLRATSPRMPTILALKYPSG